MGVEASLWSDELLEFLIWGSWSEPWVLTRASSVTWFLEMGSGEVKSEGANLQGCETRVAEVGGGAPDMKPCEFRKSRPAELIEGFGAAAWRAPWGAGCDKLKRTCGEEDRGTFFALKLWSCSEATWPISLHLKQTAVLIHSL